jgi:hypothetical protein
MSWKNRAQVVEPQSSWKSRAIPEIPAQPQKEPFMGEGLLRGALQALPAAGSIAGGFLGSPIGPLGIAGGAALGAAGGKALENFGEGLLGDEKTQKQIYMDPVKEGMTDLAFAGAGGALKAGGGLLRKGLDVTGRGASKLTQKLGSTMTGIPAQNIKTYIEKGPEIDTIIRSSGGDLTGAADELREKALRKVSETIGDVGSSIGKMIDDAPKGQISAKPILDSLDDSIARLNPNYNASAISEIQTLKDTILKDSPDGVLTAKQANQAKRYLQDMAKSSYFKGGQMFSSSKEGASAAKQAARQARKAETALVPGSAEANRVLAELHGLEKNMSRNLLAPGKPDAGLLAAGAGANPRNARNLEKLGKLTNFDLLGEAEKLSAAKQFSDPSFLPIDTTGKSLTRTGVGAGLGLLLGGPAGAAIGGAVSSPMVLKQAIRAGRIPRQLVESIAGGPVTDEILERMAQDPKIVEMLLGTRVLPRAVKGNE